MSFAPVHDRVDQAISDLLASRPISEATLTLDGTGVNGALQYLVLRRLGAERLLAMKRVNVISASTYAYLCFLAHSKGELLWSPIDAKKWDSFNRSCHGIKPIWTAGRVAFDIAIRRRSAFDGRGFSQALEGTVSKKFLSSRVADLPSNVCFWLYEHEQRQLVSITPDSPLASMPLLDLIRSAPAVPRLFAPGTYEGKCYSDPVYSHLARQMYKTLREHAGSCHLFSNIRLDAKKNGIRYLVPHGHGNGDIMMMRDFAAFVLGLPNPRIGHAIETGLFGNEGI